MRAIEDQVVTDDGARLFYERAGEGDSVLVVLNGFYLFQDFAWLSEGRSVVGLDLRNRGRSQPIEDPSKLSRGIEQDADDLEAVRRHLGVETLDLLAHSYAASIPVLYARRHPTRVRRIVQIGPMPPEPTTDYPADLKQEDDVLRRFLAAAGALQARRQELDAVAFCRAFWDLLRPLYVFDPANAVKLRSWESCDLDTELGFMRYWIGSLLPSIQRIAFTEEAVANVRCPVLVVHGRQDRSSAYGGGRDWARRLPDARLLTVEDAAHAPWMEAPERVRPALERFLDGGWPEGAERIR